MKGPIPVTEEQFAEKFWEKVDKTSDASGCWLWIGGKNTDGYGQVSWKGKTTKTHRVSYLLSGNVIPKGLELCHSEHCVGKKNCCNPQHLTPKTNKENMADKIRDGTVAVGERCGTSKLTETQVLQIRARADENQKDLANEFGISQGTISNIILKKTWKHI